MPGGQSASPLDKMPKHEEINCQRCGTPFECKMGSILLCQCQQVHLSEEESYYVNFKYDDCLCTTCLTQLQQEYRQKMKE